MATAAISHDPLSTIRLVASDIKLAHSVFALPFALLASFMAALGPTRGTFFISNTVEPDQPGWPWHPYLHPDDAGPFWSRFLQQLLLIVAAMVLARTVAMLANRLLDRRIDAENPRTAGRAIPSGRLPAARALIALALCAAAFMLACATFGLLFENWWPLILGIPVLGWTSLYALTKRFTALCHFWLGSGLAISPLAAALAIDPHSLADQPALWLLSAMVLCWVAGFDIIYSLQDVAIDRAQKLYSIPAALGIPGAMWISRLLHAVALGCLIACWQIDPRFHWLFGVGVAIVATLLLVEHLTVARWGTTRIALSFFTINGVISCVLGALGIVDVIV